MIGSSAAGDRPKCAARIGSGKCGIPVDRYAPRNQGFPMVFTGSDQARPRIIGRAHRLGSLVRNRAGAVK